MSVVLITGADGHLGSVIARRLLAASDRQLLLGVRAADATALAAKRLALGELADAVRCQVVALDLEAGQLLPDADLWNVTEILHCAAITDFGVAHSRARRVNIEGTAGMLSLARRCANLACFAFVSTLHAAGLREGVLAETPWPLPSSFANHYEWSKWEAEQRVTNEPGLPWQILRVATVIADDDAGTVSQYNVIHNTLRLLFYGLLPVLPGNPGTRVYTVTSEFVARSVTQLLLRGDPHRCFHISQAGDDAATLGEFADAAYAVFERDPQFSRAGILRPRYCGHEAFAALAESSRRFGTATADALTSVAPFVAQLYTDKNVSTAETRHALHGATPPGGTGIVSTVAANLAATRWGRREAGREVLHRA
jgi:nucleoside-diphosphate-sugar epimerase